MHCPARKCALFYIFCSSFFFINMHFFLCAPWTCVPLCTLCLFSRLDSPRVVTNSNYISISPLRNLESITWLYNPFRYSDRYHKDLFLKRKSVFSHLLLWGPSFYILDQFIEWSRAQLILWRSLEIIHKRSHTLEKRNFVKTTLNVRRQ